MAMTDRIEPTFSFKLKSFFSFSSTPYRLMEAIDRGDVIGLRALLDQVRVNDPVSATSSRGNQYWTTPLEYALSRPQYGAQANPNIVAMLLDQGAIITKSALIGAYQAVSRSHGKEDATTEWARGVKAQAMSDAQKIVALLTAFEADWSARCFNEPLSEMFIRCLGTERAAELGIRAGQYTPRSSLVADEVLAQHTNQLLAPA